LASLSSSAFSPPRFRSLLLDRLGLGPETVGRDPYRRISNFWDASATLSLVQLGTNFLPHTYGSLLLGAMVVNLFMVMASTVTGAFLVEAGQRMGATGRLSALRMFVYNFCTLIQGPLGGFSQRLAFSGQPERTPFWL
jgi:hypothetical protein